MVYMNNDLQLHTDLISVRSSLKSSKETDNTEVGRKKTMNEVDCYVIQRENIYQEL